MKKIIIILALFIFDFAIPSAFNEANAQVAERRARKVQRRKAKRKVRKAKRRVSRRAHVLYAGLPRWRAVVAAPPRNAIVVVSNGVTFRYYSGVYYRKEASGYQITRPVVGMRVRTLPNARRKIILNNSVYYYYYGTFYQSVPDSKEYEVVDAPEGALVDAIPEGYEIKEIDGIEYYTLDDTYYQEIETDEIESGIGYQVVTI